MKHFEHYCISFFCEQIFSFTLQDLGVELLVIGICLISLETSRNFFPEAVHIYISTFDL